MSVGTAAVEHLGFDVEQRGKTLAEADLFYLDVFLQEFDLFGETNFGPRRRLERQPQQIAQLREHAFGSGHIAVHQRRDRVQRVEEKVRVQLMLQRLELRFDEPRLELRLAQRALLSLAVVEHRVNQADDARAGHELPVDETRQLNRKHALKLADPVVARDRFRTLDRQRVPEDHDLRRRLERQVHRRGADDRQRMHRHGDPWRPIDPSAGGRAASGESRGRPSRTRTSS